MLSFLSLVVVIILLVVGAVALVLLEAFRAALTTPIPNRSFPTVFSQKGCIE